MTRRTHRTVLPAAAAMAMAMGIGRFGFTPILPTMQEQAGLSPAEGAHLATINYAGYLIAAVLALACPAAASTSALYRIWITVQVASLAAMPLTTAVPVWAAARLLSGICSALIFIAVAGSIAACLSNRPQHITGWVYGGIGGGIALSGALVLSVENVENWAATWWLYAVAAVVLGALAWTLPVGTSSTRPERGRHPVRPESEAKHRGASFAALVLSYFLEGLGYIIAGTFLVALIRETSPAWLGSSVWIVVGLAALPSSVLYGRFTQSYPTASIMRLALLLQAAGMVLPVVIPGAWSAITAGLLFGGTFQGITALAIAAGAQLHVPRSAATLTIAFSAGQLLGPVAAAPFLSHGYGAALGGGAAIVALAAIPTLLIRFKQSHKRMNRAPHPSTAGK
jgi:predicted MFS family arabinose efflux permease